MYIKKANVYYVKCGGINPVIVELIADDGTVGIGEAAVAYGLGGRAAAEMICELLDRYLGEKIDPFRPEVFWTEVYDHGFWGKGGGPIFFGALSAIEQALIDIKARALGVPVYELLGGKVHNSLQTYCNGWYFGGTRNEDIPHLAEKAVADGYRALKCYPFAQTLPTGRLRHPSYKGASDTEVISRSVGLIRSIRNAVGEDVEIMLDLSAGLGVGDTIRFCEEVKSCGITYIEEPTIPGDIKALETVARSIGMRIAVGERIYSRYGFRDVLDSRTVDILQPDIGNTGGILEARKVAAMAEAYGVKVQPHICASPVSTAVGMHFSASIPNFYIQEHFPYWDRVSGYVQIVEDNLEDTVVNGKLPVRDAPGFGISLRKAVVQDYLYKSHVA